MLSCVPSIPYQPRLTSSCAPPAEVVAFKGHIDQEEGPAAFIDQLEKGTLSFRKLGAPTGGMGSAGGECGEGNVGI